MNMKKFQKKQLWFQTVYNFTHFLTSLDILEAVLSDTAQFLLMSVMFSWPRESESTAMTGITLLMHSSLVALQLICSIECFATLRTRDL